MQEKNGGRDLAYGGWPKAVKSDIQAHRHDYDRSIRIDCHQTRFGTLRFSDILAFGDDDFDLAVILAP